MDQKQMMLDALVATIRERYRDSVALAVVYGSYVTGQAGPKSDLDVVFIGKDRRASELQRTFVFEGVGYDFWCMPEDRMRRIVDEFQPLVSIFAEGRLLHADSPERRAWFAGLQRRLATEAQNSSPTRYARQIEDLLSQMKAVAFDHRLAGTAERRHLQGKMVLLAGDVLARLNRTYFHSGIRKYLDEIAGFPLQPAACLGELDAMLRDAIDTEKMARFAVAMGQFWAGVKAQYGETLCDDDLSGFYEEGLSTWNKITQAAEAGDLPLTVLAATGLENELAGFRSRGVPLTRTFEGPPPDPAGIARNAETNRQEFVGMLKRMGVGIVEFGSIDDVLAHIRSGE